MCQLSYPKAKTIYKSSLPNESSRNMLYIVKACIINFLATHKIIEGKDNNNKLYPNKQKDCLVQVDILAHGKDATKDMATRTVKHVLSCNLATAPPLLPSIPNQSAPPSPPLLLLHKLIIINFSYPLLALTSLSSCCCRTHSNRSDKLIIAIVYKHSKLFI